MIRLVQLIYLLLIMFLLVNGDRFGLYPILAYLVVGGWLTMVFRRRLKSHHSLKMGFALYIIGGALNIFGLRYFSEEVMRVFIIIFIIGLAQAFFEWKKEHGKTS